MGIITALKQQKDKNRVNVYLDDKFGFGVDLDNLVLLDLKIGREISEDELAEIVRKAEFQKTFDRVLKWATNRPHSEKEIRDYLKRKKVAEILWKEVFENLGKFGLVDDFEFAKWWIETRQMLSPKSRRILNNELRIKGIDKKIIDEVLGSFEIDEEKIALALLDKRELHWKRIEKEKRRQKMMEFLVRKGFGFGIAERVIEVYNNSHAEKR